MILWSSSEAKCLHLRLSCKKGVVSITVKARLCEAQNSCNSSKGIVLLVLARAKAVTYHRSIEVAYIVWINVSKTLIGTYRNYSCGKE